MSNFTFTEAIYGDWLLFKVQGRMDTMTSPQAESDAMKVFAHANKMAVEMSGLEYISSAGLRILLRLAKQAKRDEKAFVLVGAKGMVKDVLEESGISELFTVYQSENELG